MLVLHIHGKHICVSYILQMVRGFSVKFSVFLALFLLTSFGIDTNDDKLVLPYIYWIPKMHKNRCKHRFVCGLDKCSNELHPFFSQSFIHILSKIFKSAAKQPTQEVEWIRCWSIKIKRRYKIILKHSWLFPKYWSRYHKSRVPILPGPESHRSRNNR